MFVFFLLSVGFGLGLLFSCPGGGLLLDLLDSSVVGWNLFMIALAEVLVVSWWYGVDRMLDNLAEMGMNLHPLLKMYWKICWKFLSPAVLITLIVVELASYEKNKLASLNICICIFSVIPVFALKHIFEKGNSGELVGALNPPAKWGRKENEDQHVKEEDQIE